jgi:translation initiation factor IF-1
MPAGEAIETEARVKELLPGSVFRLELPNGHCILGFPSAHMRSHLASLEPDDRVVVRMSPFDFSKGCIVSKHSKSI